MSAAWAKSSGTTPNKPAQAYPHTGRLFFYSYLLAQEFAHGLLEAC